MKESTKERVIRYFWVTLTLAIAIYTVFVSIRTVGDMSRTNSQRALLEVEIRNLEAEIARDSAFIEQIQHSPEFLETFAREHYHRQREGETVYILK